MIHDLEGLGLEIPALQSEPLWLKAVGPAPCSKACPAGINVKAYVSLIAEGKFAEALSIVRRHCPLPGICGRICHHPCEQACARGNLDDPVAIRSLKRFIADLALETDLQPLPPALERPQPVAVIGSGPAGLTAAYDLRLAGYPVTVFEAEDEPGGMLRYGIAEYRLPRDILETEIATLCRTGIEIRTGCRIGDEPTLEGLLEGGYVAVLFAVGAQRGRALGIPGEEECDQVEDAIAFLHRVAQGDRAPIDGRVLVVGGGLTAIEAARTALRLGAQSVEVVYRRTRQEMPAGAEEVAEAEAEGITFRYLVAPVRAAHKKGRLQALECVRTVLGEPDASGRRRPVPVEGSEFPIEADRVLGAVGQALDTDFLPPEIAERIAQRGRLAVDDASMTALRGVFAAGDAVTGPATVIEAVAAGHRAARAIRSYLEEGEPDIAEPLRGSAVVEYGLLDEPPGRASRLQPPISHLAPGLEFSEVELPYDPEQAQEEAGRCLRCGPCEECAVCAPSCRRRHLLLRMPSGNGADSPGVWLRGPARVALGLPERSLTRGRLVPAPDSAADGFEPLPVELTPARVRIDQSRCRGCVRCREVCPFEAIEPLDPGDPESQVRIEAARCRGCNLCLSVCPTAAPRPTALSAGCWSAAAGDGAGIPDLVSRPLVVLTCRRRAADMGASLTRRGIDADLVHMGCAGQIDAGLLLELSRRGARRILVGGCTGDGCRYGHGGTLAARQVAIARTLLDRLGAHGESIVADWALEPLADPLDPLVGWIAEGLKEGPSASRPAGHEGAQA